MSTTDKNKMTPTGEDQKDKELAGDNTLFSADDIAEIEAEAEGALEALLDDERAPKDDISDDQASSNTSTIALDDEDVTEVLLADAEHTKTIALDVGDIDEETIENSKPNQTIALSDEDIEASLEQDVVRTATIALSDQDIEASLSKATPATSTIALSEDDIDSAVYASSPPQAVTSDIHELSLSTQQAVDESATTQLHMSAVVEQSGRVDSNAGRQLELQRALKLASEEISQLRSRNRDQKIDEQQLRSEIVTLRSQLGEQAADISEKSKGLRANSEQLETLSADVKKLEAASAALTAQLDESREVQEKLYSSATKRSRKSKHSEVASTRYVSAWRSDRRKMRNNTPNRGQPVTKRKKMSRACAPHLRRMNKNERLRSRR